MTPSWSSSYNRKGEGGDAIQHDLESLERWGYEDHDLQYGQVQGATAGLGQSQTSGQTEWMESSATEKDLVGENRRKP